MPTWTRMLAGVVMVAAGQWIALSAETAVKDRPDTRPGLEILAAQLHSYDANERASARDQLVALKAHAVPVFLRALENPAMGVRKCAVEGLSKVGPVTTDVIPALVRSLNLEDPIFVVARDGLFEVGPSIIPEAIRVFQDSPSPDLREKIAQVLGSFQDKTIAAVPFLCNVLLAPGTDGTDCYLRRYCAEALAIIAPENHAVVSALTAGLNS